MMALSADLYLGYATRGQNAWWRYVLALVAGLAIAFAAGVVTVAALMVTHLASANTFAQIQSPSNPVLFFVGNGVTFGVVLVGLVASARLIQAKRFTDVIGAWDWRLVGGGAAIWCVGLILGRSPTWRFIPRAFASPPPPPRQASRRP